MNAQQRILEINRLLNTAEDLGIQAPGLEAELEQIEGPVQAEDLPEGGETPLQQYHRVMSMRYPATFSSYEDTI